MVKQTGEGFPRRSRIVRGADFRSVYRDGLKLHSENFVLFGRQNTLGYHRLGLTVSRRIGGAVVRNRIKRLFREIFRKSSVEIPRNFDFVVNAKRGCAKAGYHRLRDEFLCVARKMLR